jgi:DNA-directed RNA polymerase subunit RPC12/RpoP
MKPKNKFQQQVMEADKNLPPITKTQVKWAYQNCFEHTGRRTKKGVISCLECGHSWTDTTVEKQCTCPNCGAKLTVADTRKQVFNQCEYFCVITTCGDFQVLRFCLVKCSARAGEKARYSFSEVVRRWITPNGKHAITAKLRLMGYYTDLWNLCSRIEICPERPVYNIMPIGVYPRQRLIPEMERSGYLKQLHGLTPFELFHTLLSDSRAETLLKTGQTSLLKFFAYNGFKYIDKYWASICICARNAYKVDDASIWRDYIDLLRFFGKDLHNAKYVCPADLKTEHDRYVQKKRDWQEKERREKAREKALEDATVYRDMKSQFFGVQFTDGLINVRVLESVEEVIQEGDTLRHCLFTNNYHLKPDSLILSASIDGKRIETVELSLSNLKVLQSRGFCNQNTEYHDRIIELVEKNIPLIRKCKRKRNVA